MTTNDTRTQLEEERRIIEAANALYALPLTFQPWGPQNQNGDECSSILMDAHGETVVYEMPDVIGELAERASAALPIRNAQVEAVYTATHEHRRFVTAGFKLPLSCVCAACDAIRAIEEAGR